MKINQLSQNENENDQFQHGKFCTVICSEWESSHPPLSEWLRGFESRPNLIRLWARTECDQARMKAWLLRWKGAGRPDLGPWPLDTGWTWGNLEQSLPSFHSFSESGDIGNKT